MRWLTKRDLAPTLQSFTSRQFQRFLSEFWERRGYQTKQFNRDNTNLDILVIDNSYTPEKTIAVKAMCRTNRVGRPVIEKRVDALDDPDIDWLRFVTTSDYSSTAREYAHHRDGIELWDKRQLCQQICKHDDLVLVQQYADGAAEWDKAGDLADRLANLGLSYTRKEALGIKADPNRPQRLHRIESDAFDDLS